MIKRVMVLTFMVIALAAMAVNGAPVTIKVALMDDAGQDQGPFYKPLIDEFEAQHPDIKVELMLQYRENFDPLAVQIAGGVAPDVIAGYGEFSGIAVREGVFMDLTPLIKRDNVQASLVNDFIPAALNQHRRGTALYGFPKYSAVGGMYINLDMLSKAGMQMPSDNWTWDDFAQMAKRLTLTDGNRVTQYGFSLNPTWIWIYPWFYAGGVDFSDDSKVTIDSPAGIRTGEFLQEMARSQSLLWQFGRFATREAAMASSGSWELGDWAVNQINIGLAPMPVGPARRAAQMNNDIIGIGRNTKHVEQAWTFLKWWFSIPVQRRYLEEFGKQPARLSLGRYWVQSITNVLNRQNAPVPPNITIFLDATKDAVEQPLIQSPDVVSNLTLAMNKIIRALQPVSTTFATHARTANAILAEMNARKK